MPSEKEIKREAVMEAIAAEFGACSNVTADAVIAALSAAEKEREGERETCFELTCEKVATHDTPIDGHGRCLYCAEHAEGVPGARRLVREGDIIEKLREWVEAQVAEKRRVSDLSGGEHGGVEFALLCEVRDFLNDLQEQSTGGEG